MTNQQLYLAIGLPTLAVLASVTVSIVQLFDIKGDIRAIHNELIDIRKQLTSMSDRVARIEERLSNRLVKP